MCHSRLTTNIIVRMTHKEAKQIIDEDEDYDDDGNLKDEQEGSIETSIPALDYCR
ncbi:MAG: hypothetical protein R2744_12300 [Bacteroidales bacterium]